MPSCITCNSLTDITIDTHYEVSDPFETCPDDEKAKSETDVHWLSYYFNPKKKKKTWDPVLLKKKNATNEPFIWLF